ncbi:hypothetical protein WOLCODRAFT_140921 [Wolfiporia cocos MD-104 SS10]|uniref:EamA domain-containing protein n=1 Tax=Wolfiporia cocos (strain MD-104) TaxID=742152 RepID=A0A2H3J5N5_WOLCO|nr:hypothetical protein WOLCODRAFT_140921 [Wolfiporia cocos MD-104 SS10]
MVLGIIVSAARTLYNLLGSSALAAVDGNKFNLMWHQTVQVTMCMALAVVISGEIFRAILPLDHPNSSGDEQTKAWLVFLLGSLISGGLGFTCIMLQQWVPEESLPIITRISFDIAAGAALPLLGLWLFGDSLNTGMIASIAVIRLGSAAFNLYMHHMRYSANRDSTSTPVEDGNALEKQISPKEPRKDDGSGSVLMQA